MAKTAIGLDISGDNWKSVSVSRVSREKLRIDGFFTFAPTPAPIKRLLSSTDEDQELEARINEWALDLDDSLAPLVAGQSEFVVGLPIDMVSLRNLCFPFNQRSKIERILPFEAEGTLPFDIEDMVFDFFPLKQSKDEAKVLSAAANRNQLINLLERLKLIRIDPVMLTSTSISFHQLAEIYPEREDRILFVHVSDHLTQVSLVEGGRVIFAHSIAIGLYPPPRFAEPAPSDGDRQTGGPSSPVIIECAPQEILEHQANAVVILTASMDRLLHFLEGYSPANGSCPPALKRMVLVGEGASLAGLAESLNERTGVTTSLFRIPPGFFSEDTEIEPELHPVMAPALALALERMKISENSLNFRRGEFSYQPERQALIRKLIFPGVLAALLLASIIAGAFIEGSSGRQEATAINQEISRIFKTAFPNAPAGNPVEQVKEELTRIKAKQAKYVELTYPSAQDSLAAISQAIPDTLPVVINSFEYTGTKINLAGVTQSYENANEIKKRLQSVPVFHEVILDSAQQRGREGEEVSFDITIDLKTKEAAP